MPRPRRGSAQAGLTIARTRKARAEAEFREIAVAERRGELVEVDAVIALEQMRGTALRAQLVAVPGRWAPRVVGLRTLAEGQRTLEQMVNELLESLSRTGEQIRDRLLTRRRATQ